jgi:predicted GNAT superfamily acetyltransferase
VIRVLDTPSDLAQLCTLFGDVFGDPVPNPIDMTGSILAGGVCIGAFADDTLVGGAWSFAGCDEDGPYQHSHSLCVASSHQGRGIGADIKSFHADWCRERGISRIRWTFDPLMPGNARFNLNKLGAVGDRWIENCYGPMPGKLDPAARTGEDAPSDRLSVTLYLDGDAPRTTGEPALVDIPPTGDAPGAVPVAAAVYRLRDGLAGPIADGWIAVGVASHGGSWAYRIEKTMEVR